MAGPAPFGVYVHIPFCTRRCDYCAFATWSDRDHLVPDYVRACRVEIARAVARGLPPASSVFFGGGTPSLLSPASLTSILAAVGCQPGAEVTVECNPETVNAAKLRGYRDAGVTRLSFGVQSMAPHVLRALGREHDAPSVPRAVRAAGEAGFADSYSVDLIFGAAGESTADWLETVSAVLTLEPSPTHVSAYGLTVEPGTPLAGDLSRHPDPDDQAEKYEVADELFAAAGLEWYEISNWARHGSECRHNQLYWRQADYRGFGCSAHSHALLARGARRWWNVRTPERYIRLVGADQSPEAAGEDLDARTCRAEALQLSLRTRDGVASETLPSWPDDPVLATLVEPDLAGRLVLTRRGRLLANEVAVRLQADPDEHSSGDQDLPGHGGPEI
jgi:putative oxygen-independent coproporphyrinogen III oxidase